MTIVNTYRLFKRAEKEIQDEIREERRSNGGKAVGNQESRMRDWCIEHNINYKRIRIVENSISQLREEINSSPLKLENGIAAEREFDPELLIKSALSGQLNDVSVYRAGARSSQFESDRGNFDLSYGSTCPRDAKLILTGGSLSKVAVKGGSTVHRLLSDTASPIKPEWLEEIFPHLCRREALGDLRYEPKTDEVWETAYLRFNGRDIATLPVRSENDELASEVLARWLAENVTMASENPLGEVLQANLVQREAARSLNIRNGSVIFPEYPSLSLAGYYKDKLNGARSIREISNPQALLLPEPDSETKELMELVRSENPETIEVCGRQKPVEYQLGHQPRVVVAFDEEADFYHQLPDDAVCLPGGRSVVFVLVVDIIPQR